MFALPERSLSFLMIAEKYVRVYIMVVGVQRLDIFTEGTLSSTTVTMATTSRQCRTEILELKENENNKWYRDRTSVKLDHPGVVRKVHRMTKRILWSVTRLISHLFCSGRIQLEKYLTCQKKNQHQIWHDCYCNAGSHAITFSR